MTEEMLKTVYGRRQFLARYVLTQFTDVNDFCFILLKPCEQFNSNFSGNI